MESKRLITTYLCPPEGSLLHLQLPPPLVPWCRQMGLCFEILHIFVFFCCVEDKGPTKLLVELLTGHILNCISMVVGGCI